MSPLVSTLQMNGVSKPRFDRGGVLSCSQDLQHGLTRKKPFLFFRKALPDYQVAPPYLFEKLLDND